MHPFARRRLNAQRQLTVEQNQRMTELRGLVAGLAKTANIHLIPGKGWAWNAAKRQVIVPVRDLNNLLRCRAIASHEVGHVLYTRHMGFRLEAHELPEGLCHLIVNAMEDPRIETGISRLYPGAKAWLWELHAQEVAEDSGIDVTQISMPLLFAACNIREYHRGWRSLTEGADAMILPEPVQDALDRTRAVRQQISQLLPHTLSLRGQSLHEDYCRLVLPRLKHGQSELIQDTFDSQAPLLSADEKKVHLAMAAMLDLMEAHIWPEIETLYQCDVSRVQGALEQKNLMGRSLEQIEKDIPLPKLIKAAFAEQTSAQGRSSALAHQILKRWYEGVARKMRANWVLQDSASRFGGGDSGPLQDQLYLYAQLKREVYPQINRLQDELSDVLRPTRKLGWKSGYSSGIKVNMRRLIQSEARQQGETLFWNRRQSTDRRSVAATLLIDLSGSMEGEKSVAALKGAVLFVEALAPLNIPTAVKGFHRRVFDIKDFDQPLTTQSRDKIAGMLAMVASSNRDAEAIQAAATELIGQAVDEHVLIVISDGRPVGENADEKLHAEIKKWRSKIHLIGLGLGEGTRHVESYYPNGRGDIPLAHLAREIGQVLRSVLMSSRWQHS